MIEFNNEIGKGFDLATKKLLTQTPTVKRKDINSDNQNDKYKNGIKIYSPEED